MLLTSASHVSGVTGMLRAGAVRSRTGARGRRGTGDRGSTGPPDRTRRSAPVQVDRIAVQAGMRVPPHPSTDVGAGPRWWVSYIRIATMTPEVAVSAATSQIAARRPNRSAVIPAIRAPAA
ncbi:hypothetical protein Abr02nite_31590 [Paractinoplanes brasiliensis]|nr:hypothetical protein Abr02nite_31590 [Actinoplanes brasiliensis]